MTRLATDATWRRRLESIQSGIDGIKMPEVTKEVDQDEEWCDVMVGESTHRVRFHDYDKIFQTPGLYEEIFYANLHCCSPSYLVNLLGDVMAEYSEGMTRLKVLDVGAGNGMVGDEFKSHGVPKIVGLDIIPEAREAALRDRQDVYDQYVVTDLTDLPEQLEERLRGHKLNCLASVAALGFGDIPPAAFARALDLVETPGWVVFNIKEDFLREDETSGFGQLIRRLNRDRYIQTYCYRRYRHRLSIDGRKLHYVAVVAKKVRDLGEELFESLSS